MDITIRNLEKVDDLQEVKKLESLVWAEDDPVPVHLMAAVIQSGGLVLGAYVEEKLIGFQYSFPGFDGKKAYLHSHTLGIHPDFRKLGIGMKLKLEQKETALQKGYDLVKWTYDPLETVNGKLNLNKLGATCSTYMVDAYGDMPDPLNIGLPSDRFFVEWDITKDKTDRGTLDPDCPSVIMTENGYGFIVPTGMQLEEKDECLFVPVPSNFQEMKQQDMNLALEWRDVTRTVFQHYFSAGYRAVDLIRDSVNSKTCYYLLEKQ